MDEEEENARRCKEFIDALEKELRKIQVFHRELPLTMQIVSQAIERSRQQLAVESLFIDRPPDYEGNSREGREMQEYLPPCSSLEEEKSKERTEGATNTLDFLRSLHQYDQDINLHSNLPLTELLRSATSAEKTRTGAFQPFHRDPTLEQVTNAISADGKGGHKKDEKPEQLKKKPRRCWSSDLHRRFLDALEQLGGSNVATPKQIRELMNIDGLTNDEVKSHLQKYRLHTRRPPPPIQSSTDGGPPFFVVGGIWVPASDEYAAAAAAATVTMTQSAETANAPGPSTEVHKPVARLPPSVRKRHERKLPPHSQGWATVGENVINVNHLSPSVSSS